MDTKDYICTELDHLKRVTGRVLDGLSHDEAMWRPGSGCNSIALMLYHSARFEDMIIQTKIQNSTALWESEKWYERLKLPKDETGAGYTLEQVDAFSVPDFKDLRDYADAVRQRTVSCIKNIALENLDKVVQLPFGEFTMGSLFALLIGHQAQHIGEMSYVRGLRKGMNK
jgi:hypothetical protein